MQFFLQVLKYSELRTKNFTHTLKINKKKQYTGSEGKVEVEWIYLTGISNNSKQQEALLF